MNKETDFDQLDGIDCSQDLLKFLQSGWAGIGEALARHLGDKVVLFGVQNVNGSITSGWVSLGTEVLPLIGGSPTLHVDVEELFGTELFGDGSMRAVSKTRQLRLVSVPTVTSFPFSDLVFRTPFKNQWNAGNIKQHRCDAAWIAANFDTNTWEALPTSVEYGWAIDLDAGGRVIMGWHPENADPGNDDAWSVDANTIGKKFGKRLHKLVMNELPKHRFYTVNTQSIVGNAGLTMNNTMSRENNDGSNRQYRLDAGPGDANSSRTNELGGDLEHNNIQPVIVYLTLVKL